LRAALEREAHAAQLCVAAAQELERGEQNSARDASVAGDLIHWLRANGATVSDEVEVVVGQSGSWEIVARAELLSGVAPLWIPEEAWLTCSSFEPAQIAVKHEKGVGDSSFVQDLVCLSATLAGNLAAGRQSAFWPYLASLLDSPHTGFFSWPERLRDVVRLSSAAPTIKQLEAAETVLPAVLRRLGLVATDQRVRWLLSIVFRRAAAGMDGLTLKPLLDLLPVWGAPNTDIVDYPVARGSAAEVVSRVREQVPLRASVGVSEMRKLLQGFQPGEYTGLSMAIQSPPEDVGSMRILGCDPSLPARIVVRPDAQPQTLVEAVRCLRVRFYGGGVEQVSSVRDHLLGKRVNATWEQLDISLFSALLQFCEGLGSSQTWAALEQIRREWDSPMEIAVAELVMRESQAKESCVASATVLLQAAEIRATRAS